MSLDLDVPIQELLQVVEAMKALLVKERQEKLQLEMQLRDEICSEMVEQMQQREQWCRYHIAWMSWAVTKTRRSWKRDTRMERSLKISFIHFSFQQRTFGYPEGITGGNV